MHLSDEQERAIATAISWYNKDRLDRPVFRLFGYAGTGKTTVLNELTHRMGISPCEIMYVAPTGRAAAVMQAKGCDATTVHTAFYTVARTNDAEIMALRDEAEDILRRQRLRTDEYNMPAMLRRLVEIDRELSGPNAKPWVDFSFKGTTAVPPGTRLIVVDEASMLANEQLDDLESLHLPIVLVGDPGQLPPPKQSGASKVLVTPDVVLSQVHRQAGDSSILDLANLARAGEFIEFGCDDDRVAVSDGTGCRNIEDIVKKVDVDLLYFDQVLCGTHKTRHAINEHMRAASNISTLLPIGADGEKLICRRNFRTEEHFISNGSMIECRRDLSRAAGIYAPGGERTIDHPVVITKIDDRAVHIDDVALWRAPLEDPREKDAIRRREEDGASRRCIHAEWGWAITVHSAQGSQWKNVCVFDESRSFRNDSAKWLYTAITRASDRLLVIRI